MTPKVSLIMLTYNRAKRVTEMLSCIKEQTFKGFEFVVINNGSTDNTSYILDKYAKEYQGSIKIVELEQAESIGKARNNGIGESTGEYLAFVDDDDIIDLDYVEYLVGLQDKYQADFVTCGADETVNGIIHNHIVFDEVMVLSPEEAVELYLKREKIRAGNPTKLVKRNLYENNPFKEEGLHEDIRVTYRLLSDAKKIVLTGKTKYHIMRDFGNQTSYMDDWSRFTKEQLEEYLDAYEERTKYIDEKFTGLYELNHYSQFSYMLSMVDKIERYNLESCTFLKGKMLEILRDNKRFIENSIFIKNFEQEWLERYL